MHYYRQITLIKLYNNKHLICNQNERESKYFASLVGVDKYLCSLTVVNVYRVYTNVIVRIIKFIRRIRDKQLYRPTKFGNLFFW